MTRDEINNLSVGTTLERTSDTRNGKVLPGAQWGFRGSVTRIFARGVNVKGQAYVCFYTAFGDSGAEMSGSISEGEEHVRIMSKGAA